MPGLLVYYEHLRENGYDRERDYVHMMLQFDPYTKFREARDAGSLGFVAWASEQIPGAEPIKYRRSPAINLPNVDS